MKDIIELSIIELSKLHWKNLKYFVSVGFIL